MFEWARDRSHALRHFLPPPSWMGLIPALTMAGQSVSMVSSCPIKSKRGRAGAAPWYDPSSRYRFGCRCSFNHPQW